MPSLRKKCSSDDEFRDNVLGEYCDMLLSRVGVIYWKATKRFLHNDFDTTARKYPVLGGEEGQTGDIPLSSSFERQVVSELERCVA